MMSSFTLVRLNLHFATTTLDKVLTLKSLSDKTRKEIKYAQRMIVDTLIELKKEEIKI